MSFCLHYCHKEAPRKLVSDRVKVQTSCFLTSWDTLSLLHIAKLPCKPKLQSQHIHLRSYNFFSTVLAKALITSIGKRSDESTDPRPQLEATLHAFVGESAPKHSLSRVCLHMAVSKRCVGEPDDGSPLLLLVTVRHCIWSSP